MAMEKKPQLVTTSLDDVSALVVEDWEADRSVPDANEGMALSRALGLERLDELFAAR